MFPVSLSFNNTVLPNYDGSYLDFPGMNTEIKLRKHQSDAVHRILTNGNTLLHHCVGAGKTYTIAAAAMKLKQYGLANKPMIVVPNHLVKQWAMEFKTLYPNANVLMASKTDFKKENRLKFVSRVATGEWDAVVIGSAFGVGSALGLASTTGSILGFTSGFGSSLTGSGSGVATAGADATPSIIVKETILFPTS